MVSDIFSFSSRTTQSTFNRPNSPNTTTFRKRSTTDGYALLFHAAAICGLAGLVAYCFYHGNIKGITIGYDNCNNVCGRWNYVQEERKIFACEGSYMLIRPYLLVFRPDGRNSYNIRYTGLRMLDRLAPHTLSKDVDRVCVADCRMYPNHLPYGNRCVQRKTKEVSNRFFSRSGIPNLNVEIAEDIGMLWKYILLLEVGAFGTSFLLSLMCVWLTSHMVWLILHITVLTISACGIYMWTLWIKIKNVLNEPGYLASELETERSTFYLIFALIATFAVPLLYLFIFIKRKEIKIFAQLQKEVIKIVRTMSLLIVQSSFTSIFISSTIFLCSYISLWIESSGILTPVRFQFLIHEKNVLMLITRWYNVFIFLWTARFLLDCQYMVVSGAVSIWYFSRNKNDLGIPIFYHLYNLAKYHLGSVSLGSLVALLIPLLKVPFLLIDKYYKLRGTTPTNKFCMHYIEFNKNLLKYFRRNAYIEVVIHGCKLRSAGKQAYQISTANNLDGVSNNTGCFVLNLLKVLVSVITIIGGTIIFQKDEGILHIWVILILIGYFAYLISDCFFSLYQAIIDSIFMCFHEDCYYHDSFSKPYYASAEFLEFIGNYNRSLSTESED